MSPPGINDKPYCEGDCNSGGSITLTWDTPLDSGGAGKIGGYHVFMKTKETQWHRITKVPQPCCSYEVAAGSEFFESTRTVLLHDSTYQFHVRAVNEPYDTIQSKFSLIANISRALASGSEFILQYCEMSGEDCFRSTDIGNFVVEDEDGELIPTLICDEEAGHKPGSELVDKDPDLCFEKMQSNNSDPVQWMETDPSYFSWQPDAATRTKIAFAALRGGLDVAGISLLTQDPAKSPALLYEARFHTEMWQNSIASLTTSSVSRPSTIELIRAGGIADKTYDDALLSKKISGGMICINWDLPYDFGGVSKIKGFTVFMRDQLGRESCSVIHKVNKGVRAYECGDDLQWPFDDAKYRSGVSKVFVSASKDGKTYEYCFTGLSAGSEYTFWVNAYNNYIPRSDNEEYVGPSDKGTEHVFSTSSAGPPAR